MDTIQRNDLLTQKLSNCFNHAIKKKKNIKKRKIDLKTILSINLLLNEINTLTFVISVITYTIFAAKSGTDKVKIFKI